MTRQSKKQVQNQAQDGRSMIEMLGVLAIIAVLSIGGIVGYKLAMNHYQASQIAHEMNMMRTDAQIKIAQGTEKLILGEPYDPISESTLGHIQFNDDYPVDFACALADDETVELSNISCHVANAYYIELQNIPEGVCKPLAELVNGMNNIIAFNVNKNEYPETGKCETGNGNVLNAVFSAEAVSELKVCTEDTDCESENAPYCDPSRHVCVRCYEDSQCAHNQYCEDNTCVTCESGVWNGENCVECTADDDCADTPDTPKCNTGTNTCVECLNNQNCIEKDTNNPVCNSNTNTCEPCPPKSIFYEGECHEYECRTNEDCADKGSGYYCYLYEGYRWDSEWENKPGTYFGGSCHKAETDKISGEITHYVKSKDIMTWWSAQRFCEALNMTPVSSSDIGCRGVIEETVCTSDTVTQIQTDFTVENTHGLWMELIEEPDNKWSNGSTVRALINGAIDPDNMANGDGTSNYGFCRH